MPVDVSTIMTTLMTLGQQGEAWVWAHPLEAGAVVVGSAAVSRYIETHWRQVRQATTHGGGRWATRREIARAGLYSRDGFVLGRLGGRWLVDGGDTHMLLCGPTGSGKDTRHLWPTTRRYRGSMVIVDVKKRGENLQHCGQARAAKGPVWVFAPSVRQSCHYNLLDFVSWGQDEAHDEVTTIIDAMMAPARRSERSDQNAEFFRSRGRTVLRAATLHVGHHEPRRSFGGVLAFLADRERALAALRTSSLAQVRQVGEEYSRLTGDELNGVWSNTTNPLDVYRSPLIQAHTETSDFDFRALQQGATPSTVYLVAPSPLELPTLQALLRPVLVQGLARLSAAWEAPRWELTWLLNEFPAFGYMAPFELAAPVIRGNAMRLLVVAQDPGQLFTVYGEETPLWSNMAAKVFHTPNNDRTAERLSHMLGETTVSWETTSRQRWQVRTTATTHQGRRRLVDMAEVMGLPRTEVLMSHERCPYPIRAKKLTRWQAGS